ncbi:alpha/beta fold hydrolase [uncultured Paludibaculum sp.]|uniref:alpha/beta hydrolase n=1 Tax=uncultured Paludibaculum sp. TaxID=1765020 RepID=UPI002AAB480B|nr:alpha/beta fold hydrolase [uncultured Paludibaculum sp.]
MRIALLTIVFLAILPVSLLFGQTDHAALKGSVQRIKVHGVGLEKNLEGDSPDRDVSIYLPPSYAKQTKRRYPVLYMLHGFTDSDELWFGFRKHWISLPAIVDPAMASGAAKEMIIVMPNAFTAYQGSMYSTSVTTGDWEGYVSRELVAYVDQHYRTLPRAESRGLAGHSMGGYGAMRIGMKHPEVFSSVYLLSPCCMSTRFSSRPQGTPAPAEAIRSTAEVEKADFGTKAMLASAAAWSPNPANPPLYLDLPTKGGEPQPEVLSRWAANAPLSMLDQYVPNIRRLHALAFDAGDEDRMIAGTNVVLDRMLSAYGIAHTYEVYKGNHINHIADRIEKKVLPFFSTNLVFAATKK